MPKAANTEELEVTVKPKVLKCRVLPKGAGKLYTGEHDPQTNTFPTYEKGDVIELHPSIAQEQEDNGYVEIVG